MHPIIPQIVGLVAVVFFLLSYQLKRRRDIIVCNAASRGLYVLQYLLLGAISGAVLDVMGVIASVVAQKKEHPFIKKHIRLVFALVNVMIVAAGLLICFMRRSALDLLPIAGVLLHTGAFWMTDEKSIRRISLAGSPFWLAYNLASAAYGSAIGDILSMVSIVTAMIKYKDFQRVRKEE